MQSHFNLHFAVMANVIFLVLGGTNEEKNAWFPRDTI